MSVLLPLREAHRRAMLMAISKILSLSKNIEIGGCWIEDIPQTIEYIVEVMKNDPTIKSITIEFGWCPVTDHHAFLKILNVKREEENRELK